jgi:hypothetical protein
MGLRGAHRLIVARPVEDGLWIVLRQRKRKIQPLMEVKGLAPSCCLPHGGREGVTFRNFHASFKKLGRDFP